ncbi:MAG: class I SAM-dependent methyltransferase [Cyanophyceae cyanobacterium]
MADLEPQEAWFNQFATAYSLEERKRWYSRVADTYNRVRPRYPRRLIEQIIAMAQLPRQAHLLEIGCGPGTATQTFAELGFSLVCLEPSPEACQLAQQNCRDYATVEIINTTFEEWRLETKFDAVLAASAFHWVSPETRYSKSAQALIDGGSLILLWNTPPHPNYEVYQVLHDIYQAQAPALPQYVRYHARQTHLTNLNQVGEAIVNSKLFKNLVFEQMECAVTYSIDDYLALLSTLSPYIALNSQKRHRLFTDLRAALEINCGSTLDLCYLSAAHVAQKR